MGDKLSCWQTRGWHKRAHTLTDTDAGNDKTRGPKLASGKNAVLSKKRAHVRFDLHYTVYLYPVLSFIWTLIVIAYCITIPRY